MDIECRRVVEVNIERRRVVALGEQQPVEERVDLADLGIGAGHMDAVAIGRARRAADEVVVFVRGHDEQRIVLVDAVGGKTREELAERDIIGHELGDVFRFARTECMGRSRQIGAGVERQRIAVMRIGDIYVGNRHTCFEHGRGVTQRLTGRRAEGVGEAGPAVRVGDDAAVGILDRAAAVAAGGCRRTDHRRDIHVAEQGLEAGITARLVGQCIGTGVAVVAERAAQRAMHRYAEIVGARCLAGGRVRGRTRQIKRRRDRQILRRTDAENGAHVGRQALEFHIGDRERADVAASTGERRPRRREDLAVFIDQLRLAVGAERGPVQKRAGKADGTVVAEEAIAVRHRHAHAVAIGAGEHGENIGRGMRDQRCVVVAAHRAIVLHEVEQVGHLLEVRWHVGIIPPQVDIVELDVHDMLDLVAGGLQSACRLRGRGSSEKQRGAEQQRSCSAENAFMTHGLLLNVSNCCEADSARGT